jgi:hypothetical protein
MFVIEKIKQLFLFALFLSSLFETGLCDRKINMMLNETVDFGIFVLY